LLGGILGQFLGWRSNFYFLAIVGGILFAMVLFFLPETLRKKHDDDWDEEKVQKKRSMMDNIRHVSAAFKPMIGLLSYPNVMVITMYNTVIFGALYFMVRDLFLIFLIRMIIKLAIHVLESNNHSNFHTII
jgi:predicted MFS family arabinose efflux permease